MAINKFEKPTDCPRCEQTKTVKVIVGFPKAECTNCGKNRA